MPRDIAQFYAPSSAPATFVTVNGTPVRRPTNAELSLDPSTCRNAGPEPYLQQLVFRPDFPYFKRWQCRANAYINRFEAEHPNVPSYRGQSPY